MEQNKRMIQYKEFQCEPFGKLIVGDPDCLEQVKVYHPCNGKESVRTVMKSGLSLETRSRNYVSNRVTKKDKQACVLLVKITEPGQEDTYQIAFQSAQNDLYDALREFLIMRNKPQEVREHPDLDIERLAQAQIGVSYVITYLRSDTGNIWVGTDKMTVIIETGYCCENGKVFVYKGGAAHQVILPCSPDVQSEEYLEKVIRTLFHVTKESAWQTRVF